MKGSVRRPVVAAVLLGVALGGCSGGGAEPPPDPSTLIDSGSWYVREPWPHDGHPVATEHFVVYSDGASPEARNRLGALAEDVWGEVTDVMGLEPSMLKYPAGQSAIDLYANRYHVLEGGGARAYYAGVILPSFDFAGGSESTDPAVLRVTLKHELVHVAEALLKGRYVGDVPVSDPRRMPVWFSEGSAEALSGGSTVGAPRTLDQMDGLIARYGTINPIGWRVDLPISDAVLDAYPHYYYPMAHLAVDYLLDARGLGRSPRDISAVMLDMGNDVPFADAFAAHMGIEQDEYEARFFTLMDGYLPQDEFPFEAVGLGLVLVVAAGVLAGSTRWGARRWAPIGVDGKPAPSRRILVTEVVVGGVAAMGFTALALFSIGFDELPAGVNRVPAYAVTAAFYLLAAGAILAALRLSVGLRRRWAHAVIVVIGALMLATAASIDALLL